MGGIHLLSPISQPGTFTELDRFMFESWGYLVIPDVLNEEEVKRCLEASIRHHGTGGIAGFGQVGRGHESEPELERLIDHRAILPKVRAIYGDRFILQSAWCTKQPAHGGWAAGIRMVLVLTTSID